MPLFTLLFLFMIMYGVFMALLLGAHWAFYLYQIIYFLNPEHRWWSAGLPAISYSKVTVLFLISLYLFKIKSFSDNKLTAIPQFKYFILILLTYGCTTFYAINSTYHFTTFIELIKMFIVLGLAFKVLNTAEKLKLSLLTYILGSVYISYEAFVVGRNSSGRIEGIGLIDGGPDSNFVSCALVASIPLCIYFIWWGSKYVRLFAFFSAPIILNGLVLINSRGAFLGVAVSILIFMWVMIFSKFKFGRQKLIAIMLVMVGLIGVGVIVDKTFLDRIHTLTQVKNEKTSGSHRYRMWLATFDLVEDYPFGVGASGYELLSPIYVPAEVFGKNQKAKAVHSIWFQALSEIGWVGLIIFIGLVHSTFRAIKNIKIVCKNLNDYSTYYLAVALQCGFIGTLITSSFINQFRVQIVYWCILFIICLYSIINKKVIIDNKVSW
jgi:hypothetical protein